MTEQPFEIDSRHNRISGIMIIPRSRKRFPCAVLSHGLVSSKESSKYMALSERFAEAGIASCRFDYHGCGESGGNIEDTTLSIRLDNLSAVVEYVLSHSSVDPQRVGIIGSRFDGSFLKPPATNGSGVCPSGPLPIYLKTRMTVPFPRSPSRRQYSQISSHTTYWARRKRYTRHSSSTEKRTKLSPVRKERPSTDT